jgi:hypothetical protein
MAIDFAAANNSLLIRNARSTVYKGPAFAAQGGPVSFTRASGATRVNSLGVIETVSNDVPRLDYDPVTLACKGLLVEEQRTNLLLNSATLSTQNVTVTAVAHTLSFYGTGTVTLTGVSTAGPLVGTGAYPNRVSLTFTPTAGTLTLTVTGSVTQAQLEVGSFATSYIPTTAATVTRVIDVANVATSQFPYSATEGTLIAAANARGFFDYGAVAEIGVTSSDRTTIYCDSTAKVYFAVTSSGAGTAGFSASVTAGTTFKAAGVYKVNDYEAVLNGTSLGTDVAGAVAATANNLGIGKFSFPGAGGQFNGWIRQITYIPRRLSSAELQSRTA